MEENLNKTTKKDIYNIDPRSIVVMEGFNSRVDFGDIEELAAQIAEQGVLNPITVIPFKEEDGTEKYKLIDGERRYRACMHILKNGGDIARVPAIFAPKNIPMAEMLVQQLMRNEGKQFNEYELGLHFQKLVKLGYERKEIAKKLGIPDWKVNCFLAHLNRDERVQNLMKDGKITGADVRRIYSSAKNDTKAVKEILKLANMAEQKNEKKITLKDLDETSDYNISKESTAVKKGLSTLFKWYERYAKMGVELDMGLKELLDALNNKKTLKDIFEEARTNVKDVA